MKTIKERIKESPMNKKRVFYRKCFRLMLVVSLPIEIASAPCFARTINIGPTYLGVVRDYSWYGQYKSRETISDPLDLPVPSQDSVDSWKRKNLSMPYPPRYLKPRQTSDDQKVWEGLQSHYNRLQSLSNKIELAYIEYIRYGLDVKNINIVCDRIRAATQVKSWKDYWERTTRIRKNAKEELRKIIRSVEAEVDLLFEPLVAIKKKEYNMWANKHPQQAMAIAVKHQVKEAEIRAENAELAARRAEERAAAAEASAAAAGMRAAAAEARAANAEQDAANAIQRANRGW